MATESLGGNGVPLERKTSTTTLGLGAIVKAILTPLSSLKLTVVLLVAATLVTWIATLDQTRFDILEVKNKHFQNVLVEVPFQTFFVPRWFPDFQNVPGSFYIPSGITILVAMLINLTAAHLLRFRLQAGGLRLVFGLLAAIGAAGLTWAVVFNGQNADGFQTAPPISWELMWRLLQVAVLGIGIGACYGFVTMDRDRKIERILMMIGAIVCLLSLGVTFLLGDSSFIGDSAMRILWQLTQASIAATAGLVAAMLLFKRKAGIVVVHLGIAGLMMNEIYVTATNEEQRMMIREGQTVSSAFDIREVEFVAVDQSDPETDQIVVVPADRLQAGRLVSDSALPFEVTCVAYYSNVKIIRAMGGIENQATAGIGKKWLASPVDGGVGTAVNQRADSAAAYVELKNSDSGESLGTFMVSQLAWENGMVDSIRLGDKTWQIGMRFKTDYKPYSMTLKDVQAEYYLSTNTPKWFASEVVLDDHRTGTKSDQRIWMNNPLRYSGETFYQSHYEKSSDGTEITVLQIVRNKGWMIPYVCCMFTVIGLVAQFGSSLTGYLQKKRKTAADETHVKRTWKSSLVAVGLIVIFGGYVFGQLGKAISSKTVHNDLRLDQLGAIPVSFNGRVQPLDSVARNTVRQLGNRDTVVAADGSKVSAIRWFADTVFEQPGFDSYRVFRIEDPTIRSALALEENHDRFLYSLDDLSDAEQKIMELMQSSLDVEPEQWSPFQKRLMGVRGKLQQVMAIRAAFGHPTQRVGEDDVVNRLRLAETIVDAKRLPLAVPNSDPDRPWVSFSESVNRRWLRGLADQNEAKDLSELATALTDSEMIEPVREEMIRSEIIRRMVSDPDLVKLLQDSTDAKSTAELARVMEQGWDDIPAEALAELRKAVTPFVDSVLDQRRPQVERSIKEKLVKLAGGDQMPTEDESVYPSIAETLEKDYRAGNAESFNTSLGNYLTSVTAQAPTGMKARGVRTERFYNTFSPFYLAMVIYLVAAVIAGIGWLGWMRPFQQAASWLLMLGLALQVSGLVMRVIISGRPPVTNLYSSALFVSAAYVLLMLIVERITRIGIGNAMAGLGGYLALLWAWTMSIVDGDTFTVLVAVLDTQFWLSTHVVIVSLGYSATLVAGFLGLAYVISGLLTTAQDTPTRRLFGNVIYGTVCFGLLASFFGTVLGGLWGDDSWGRFWGWDPKENGALMIVLWNAVVLHARWGGMVKTRGLAALAILGNIVTLWSWKGVNAMGVGLHAYAGTEDTTMKWILVLASMHLLVVVLAAIPTRFWMSHAKAA